MCVINRHVLDEAAFAFDFDGIAPQFIIEYRPSAHASFCPFITWRSSLRDDKVHHNAESTSERTWWVLVASVFFIFIPPQPDDDIDFAHSAGLSPLKSIPDIRSFIIPRRTTRLWGRERARTDSFQWILFLRYRCPILTRHEHAVRWFTGNCRYHFNFHFRDLRPGWLLGPRWYVPLVDEFSHICLH